MMDWNSNDALEADRADFEHDSPARKRHREEEAARKKEKLDDALDQALEQSFPGSDPVSVIQPSPSVYDKRKS
jgi:hypothetical protein